jgi:hypothetical protein
MRDQPTVPAIAAGQGTSLVRIESRRLRGMSQRAAASFSARSRLRLVRLSASPTRVGRGRDSGS